MMHSPAHRKKTGASPHGKAPVFCSSQNGAHNTERAAKVERRGAGRIPEVVVVKMYIDYLAGISFTALGPRYGYDRGTVSSAFRVRGWNVRPGTNPDPERLPNGCYAPAKPLTQRQVDALIESATKIRIPDALRLEWRTWPLARRADFIARIRARLQPERDRPNLPFSQNVEPFDYGTQRAHEIMAELNRGLGSRQFRMKIDLCSQGVICRGSLWFWTHKTGYEKGPWNPERGRPLLNHVIWKEAHGCKVPKGHVLSFIDGNPNNLVPENMRLRTRNDVARQNQAAALSKKSRELTKLLLTRTQRKKANPHENDSIDQISDEQKRSNQRNLSYAKRPGL